MTEDDIARRSPAYEHHQDLGVVTYATGGWEAPFYFETNEQLADQFDVPDHADEAEAIGIEHQAVRETAGLCDLTAMAPIEVAGSGAAELVQQVCSNDMAIDVHRARYTMILDEDGGILGDVVVTRLEENRFFVVTFGGVTASDLTDWIGDYAPADVSVTNLDDAYCATAVWGPAARDILQPLTETELSDDAFPYFTGREFDVSGMPVVGQRVSYVGEMGWELWTPMGYGSQLWDRLWDQATEHGAVPMGFGALDTMGVEKGNRFLGFDVGPEYNPFEAALEFTVDMETEFVGKEALERARADGIDRRISCITMDDASVHLETGQSVLVDSEVVAETVRTAYGYSVDESIAYAYLPEEAADAGTSVEIEVDGTHHSGTVREEPLFDPDRNRV